MCGVFCGCVKLYLWVACAPLCSSCLCWAVWALVLALVLWCRLLVRESCLRAWSFGASQQLGGCCVLCALCRAWVGHLWLLGGLAFAACEEPRCWFGALACAFVGLLASALALHTAHVLSISRARPPPLARLPRTRTLPSFLVCACCGGCRRPGSRGLLGCKWLHACAQFVVCLRGCFFVGV